MRYCSDWKPDAGPRTSRNFTYSLGVSVASTPHCSNSWRWICLTRARPFWAGPRSSTARRASTSSSSWMISRIHSSRRLVLDDEQQLVVVLGVAQRVLGAEQLLQVEVARVGEAAAQVARDALLDLAAVLAHFKRFELLAQVAHQHVHVGHLVAVGDDPEVHVAHVAHDGDVQAHAVGDHRDRVVGLQPRARHVERELRAGDVGDHEVPGRPAGARGREAERQPRGAREDRGRDEVVGVLQQLGGQRAVALLHVRQRLVGLAQPLDRVRLVGEQRRGHQQDAVAVGAELLAGAHATPAPARRAASSGRSSCSISQRRTAPAQTLTDDVVDRRAVVVLGRLELAQRQLAEDEAPVRRDAAVEDASWARPGPAARRRRG